MKISAFVTRLNRVFGGFDSSAIDCWASARGGYASETGKGPMILLAIYKVEMTTPKRWDIFSDPYYMIWNSNENVWIGPRVAGPLGGKLVDSDLRVVFVDMTPQWHRKTKRFLSTGGTCAYMNGNISHNDKAMPSIAYAGYAPLLDKWSEWQTLRWPGVERYSAYTAGCAQRYDLDNGEIILPFYFKAIGDDRYSVASIRCSFDGESLIPENIGNVLSLDIERGLCEPSVIRYHGLFYLTLRNDLRSYVAVSSDGLRYDDPIPWLFDDGSDLGSYNTQQHWVMIGKNLYLVYTRKGLNNDHIPRHRAPLLMAMVDVNNLRVIRETEQEVMPQRGAMLGNFGVFAYDDNHAGAVAVEWMNNHPAIQISSGYGSDNSLFIAEMFCDA